MMNKEQRAAMDQHMRDEYDSRKEAADGFGDILGSIRIAADALCSCGGQLNHKGDEAPVRAAHARAEKAMREVQAAMRKLHREARAHAQRWEEACSNEGAWRIESQPPHPLAPERSRLIMQRAG